jgi:hypothetical protein
MNNKGRYDTILGGAGDRKIVILRFPALAYAVPTLKRERPERILGVNPAPTSDSESPSKLPTRNLPDKKRRKIISKVTAVRLFLISLIIPRDFSRGIRVAM